MPQLASQLPVVKLLLRPTVAVGFKLYRCTRKMMIAEETSVSRQMLQQDKCMHAIGSMMDDQLHLFCLPRPGMQA